MINFYDVSKKFKRNVIFDKVNLELKKGEFVIISGSNGSGKSTFIKLILNQYKVSSGKIKVDSEKIAYIPENLSLPDTVKLKTFFEVYCKFLKVKYNSILKYLDAYNIKKYEHVLIKNLSKGTRQKIALVMVLIRNVEILICDELISGLDIENQEVLLEFIEFNLKRGCLVILSTHFIDVYKKLNPTIYKIVDAKIVLC